MHIDDYREALKKILRGDFDNASEEEKAAAVRELIHLCSLTASATTMQPVPFVDGGLITPIHIAMVQGIARMHRCPTDLKSILEVLRTFRASLLAQQLAIAATKFIPAFGWLVSTSVTYALTYALGEASDRYFRSGRSVVPKELRAMFRRIYRRKFSEMRLTLRHRKDLKKELDEIEKARRTGEINEEEARRRKQEALSHA
jgi:uncharacterized protein (DUF697 family)